MVLTALQEGVKVTLVVVRLKRGQARWQVLEVGAGAAAPSEWVPYGLTLDWNCTHTATLKAGEGETVAVEVP